MPFIYYSFREIIVFLFLIGFLSSCSLFEEERVSAKRDFWFESNIKQLDQIYIVPTLGMSDSVTNWLGEKERVLNQYEPFCEVVNLVNDSFYQIQFLQKSLDSKAFEIEVVNMNVIISYSSEASFYEHKAEVLYKLKVICDEVFINQRKNTLLRSGYLKKEFNEINRYHPWSMKIPDDFKIIRHKEKFLWIRTETTAQNSHLLIYRTPYISDNQFEMNELVQLRDSLGKNNILYRNYDSTMFMQTEFYFPVTIRDNSYESFFSKRINGAWTVSKESKDGFALGGCFVGYALVDSDEPNDFYYLEAFFSAPNVDKLPYIRTLEAILRTFELNNNHE